MIRTDNYKIVILQEVTLTVLMVVDALLTIGGATVLLTVLMKKMKCIAVILLVV